MSDPSASINVATIVFSVVALVVGLLTIESNRRLCRRLDALTQRETHRKRRADA